MSGGLLLFGERSQILFPVGVGRVHQPDRQFVEAQGGLLQVEAVLLELVFDFGEHIVFF